MAGVKAKGLTQELGVDLRLPIRSGGKDTGRGRGRRALR